MKTKNEIKDEIERQIDNRVSFENSYRRGELSREDAKDLLKECDHIVNALKWVISYD